MIYVGLNGIMEFAGSIVLELQEYPAWGIAVAGNSKTTIRRVCISSMMEYLNIFILMAEVFGPVGELEMHHLNSALFLSRFQ